MDNQQATPFEIGWLLGIIEGEGSLGLYWNQVRKQIYPVIHIINTDKVLIDEAIRILYRIGAGGHVLSSTENKMPHWKRRYDLHVVGIKRLAKLLPRLLEYWTIPTIKRHKANMILEFCLSRLSNPVPENGRYTNREHEIMNDFYALKGKSSEAIRPPAISG